MLAYRFAMTFTIPVYPIVYHIWFTWLHQGIFTWFWRPKGRGEGLLIIGA